jgi:hypothetical protein
VTEDVIQAIGRVVRDEIRPFREEMASFRNAVRLKVELHQKIGEIKAKIAQLHQRVAELEAQL